MATVYLAHDLKHDRDVAIKVLHADLGAALGGERFLSEIKTTARLQHPHILPLLDSGDADGLLFYVMPYVAGETLRARLERERQLPIEDALRIAREVADALGAAHAQGIVHRDIKPENILLQGGHALVADFGIALAVQTAAGARMTQTGLSLGTPQYMSPEQAMGEKQIDARADIYALGAVTYEMLTGDPPFTGTSVQAVVAKVMSAEPERPTLVRKTIPPHVEAAVLRALEKLPADRFGTAADFSAALAYAPPGVPTAHVSGAVAMASSSARGAAQRRVRIAAGVMIAAAGLAGGWIVGRIGRPATDPEAPVSASVLLGDSLQIEPQLFMPEGTEALALSPNGRQLVIAAGLGASARLYVRSLSQFGLRRLDGTDGAEAPFFSRSGGAVYFFGPQGLRRVTLADGSVTTLRPPPLGSFESEAWGGTVLPDGRIVLSQRLASELITLTPAGDSVHAVACMATCGYPHALGDAQHVLVSTGDALWVADVETGRGVPVRHRAASGDDEVLSAVAGEPDGTGHLVYVTLDGRLYAAPFDVSAARVTGPPVQIADSVRVEAGRGGAQLAANASGVLAYVPGDVAALGILVRADRRGRIDTIPAPPDDYDGFSLSPDGSRLAAHVATAGGGRIEVIDVATGRVTPWVSGRALGTPAWTADGRHIVYARGDTALIGNPDQSTAPTPLPPGTAADAISTVTRDGRWVIEHGQASANGAIEALARDGSGRRVVIAPAAYSMPMQAVGGTELIVAKVSIGHAVAGRAQTLQTFYTVRYDSAGANPFGSPEQLFAAAVADFPGRNYAVGMNGNRFVFKQPVVSRPLKEVRVLTSWTSRLPPGAGR